MSSTPGDGKMSYEEFIASLKVAGLEGPPSFIAVNNATFTYYDTVGLSEAPDGFMARSDVAPLFDFLDQSGISPSSSSSSLSS